MNVETFLLSFSAEAEQDVAPLQARVAKVS